MSGPIDNPPLKNIAIDQPQAHPTHDDTPIETASPEQKRTLNTNPAPELVKKVQDRATKKKQLLDLTPTILGTLFRMNWLAYEKMKNLIADDSAYGNQIVREKIDATLFDSISQTFFHKNYKDLIEREQDHIRNGSHAGKTPTDFADQYCQNLATKRGVDINTIRKNLSQDQFLTKEDFDFHVFNFIFTFEHTTVIMFRLTGDDYFEKYSLARSQILNHDPQNTELSIGPFVVVIPPEIKNLTHLTKLSLQNNRLDTFPKEIADLTQLKVLDLSDNYLTWNPILETLYQNGCKIIGVQRPKVNN